MNLAENPHQNADSSVNSLSCRSPVFRISKRLLSLPGLRRGDRPQDGRGAVRLWGTRHSKARDRQAATYHYDVPGEFYALWLGRPQTLLLPFIKHSH